jgi:hypothetical protein
MKTQRRKRVDYRRLEAILKDVIYGKPILPDKLYWREFGNKRLSKPSVACEWYAMREALEAKRRGLGGL